MSHGCRGQSRRAIAAFVSSANLTPYPTSATPIPTANPMANWNSRSVLAATAAGSSMTSQGTGPQRARAGPDSPRTALPVSNPAETNRRMTHPV